MGKEAEDLLTEEEYDHDYEAPDECAVCGEAEDEEHHDSSLDMYHHDYEATEECTVCGMDEADPQHGD